MRTRMQPIDNVWSKLPRVVRDLSNQLRQPGAARDRGWRHRTRPDPARGRQGPTDPPGPQRDRPRHRAARRSASPPASQPTGVLRCGRRTRAARSSSRSPTTARTRSGCTSATRPSRTGISQPSPARRMTSTTICSLVFLPGFSTAATVTNVSGRGVGMDVVKTNIERIGGSIDVESDAGQRHRVAAEYPADAGDRPGPDRRVRRPALRDPAGQPARTRASRRREGSNGGIEEIGDAKVYRLRGALLPLIHLDRRPQAPTDRTVANR